MPNDLITWINLILTIITVVGGGVTSYIVLYKAKPERKKLEAESESSIADAAESIVSGAKGSTDLLIRRLEEMDLREIKREQELSSLKIKMVSVEASLTEWQGWAERLAYQVKSLGHVPVPFKLYEKDTDAITDKPIQGTIQGEIKGTITK